MVTSQPYDKEYRSGFCLLRRPTARRLLQQFRTAEVIVLQGLPLRLGWPLLLKRGRALAVHHAKPQRFHGGIVNLLRPKLAARVRHSAVSKALARQLPWRTELILPNPYDAEIFGPGESCGPRRDVAFVGRLIPEKGVSVLIQALAILQRNRCPVTATIVGDGPEGISLRQMVAASGLQESVVFTGQLTGPPLAQLLRAHHALVIPSVYPEPFGVIALEGAACGCVLIGSDAGGLPEAIGPCGVTFPCGDAAALAQRIRAVLGSPEIMNQCRTSAAGHLAGHHPEAVVSKYVEALRR